VTGRRGKRRKQLLDELEERQWYWILKEEALYRTQLRTSFEGRYGPDVKQTADRMV
jgi:hypothetical protein